MEQSPDRLTCSALSSERALNQEPGNIPTPVATWWEGLFRLNRNIPEIKTINIT